MIENFIKKYQKIFFIIFFFLVIFLSKKQFFYRQLGYSSIPFTTDILDEKNYIWAAKSFLQTGIPTAWSNLFTYKKLTNGGSLVGINIYFEGKRPSFKRIEEIKFPLTAVAEIDVGKGKEHILMVQPFLDHSFLSGVILV